MQTQCPQCGTRFRITEAQLDTAEGRVRCGLCDEVFNAHSVNDSNKNLSATIGTGISTSIDSNNDIDKTEPHSVEEHFLAEQHDVNSTQEIKLPEITQDVAQLENKDHDERDNQQTNAIEIKPDEVKSDEVKLDADLQSDTNTGIEIEPKPESDADTEVKLNADSHSKSDTADDEIAQNHDAENLDSENNDSENNDSENKDPNDSDAVDNANDIASIDIDNDESSNETFETRKLDLDDIDVDNLNIDIPPQDNGIDEEILLDDNYEVTGELTDFNIDAEIDTIDIDSDVILDDSLAENPESENKNKNDKSSDSNDDLADNNVENDLSNDEVHDTEVLDNNSANDDVTNTAQTESLVSESIVSDDALTEDNVTDNAKEVTNETVPDLFEEDNDHTVTSIIPDDLREEAAANESSFIKNILWTAGVLLLSITLLLEYLWFNRDQFAQSPDAQALITKACEKFDCSKLTVRDPSNIELLTRNVYSHPNEKQALMISIALQNNAKFSQPYPVLQINFSDILGNNIAARRFTPAEYLKTEAENLPLLQSNAESTFNLEIEDPGKHAITYEFSFL